MAQQKQSQTRRFIYLSFVVSFLLLTVFQNCVRMKFSPAETPLTELSTLSTPYIPENLPELDVTALPVKEIKEEPPVVITPPPPKHGDIVGKLAPFTVPEEKELQKTKVIIVVDNSQTMSQSQEKLGRGIDSMMSSLIKNVEEGLNPELEFYIMTTSAPEETGHNLVLGKNSTGIRGYLNTTWNHLYEPNSNTESLYSKNSTFDSFEVKINGKNEIINYPKTYNLQSYKDLGLLQLTQNSNLTEKSDFFKKLGSYYASSNSIEENNSFNVLYNDPLIISNSGEPVPYQSNFSFNTHYPEATSNRNIIKSEPFKKFILSKNNYLVDANQTERSINSEYLINFKEQLKKSILSIGTQGSNKEMGLCALHKSISMTGENQIITPQDRVVFMVISDEDDQQLNLSDCALKETVAYIKPQTTSKITVNCSSGSDCQMPEQPDLNIQLFVNSKIQNPKVTPQLNFNFSYEESTAIQGENEIKYFWSFYSMGKGYQFKPVYSTEKSIIGYYDGTLGRDIQIEKRNSFSDIVFGYPEAWGSKRPLTFNEFKNIPVGNKIGFTESEYQKRLSQHTAPTNGIYSCLPEDRQKQIEYLITQDPFIKDLLTKFPDRTDLIEPCFIKYSKYDPLQKIKLTNNNNYNPTKLEPIELPLGKSINRDCSNDELSIAQASMTALFCNSTSKKENCQITSCKYGAYYSGDPILTNSIYNYRGGTIYQIITSDQNFASDFKAGYNKAFKAIYSSYYGAGTESFSSYENFEKYLDRQGFTISRMEFSPYTKKVVTGTRELTGSFITGFSRTVSRTSILDQAVTEGVMTAEEIQIPQNITSSSADRASFIREKIVTAFHRRIKNKIGNNYMISMITIPSGKYVDSTKGTKDQCPGVVDSQSAGKLYSQLLDDTFFTTLIKNGDKTTAVVDDKRRASADICEGDFKPALEPIYNYISKVPKKRYSISVPKDRLVHSVSLKRNNIQTLLPNSEWSFQNNVIEFTSTALEIGDEVEVNLTLPKDETKN